MLNPKSLFHLIVQAGKAWVDDYAPSMGAAIAYYTVFSLAPLLVIVIALAGALFGREAVQGLIVDQLSGLIGQDGASLVQDLVASASDTDKGLIAGLISLVCCWSAPPPCSRNCRVRWTASGTCRRRTSPPACGRCCGRGCCPSASSWGWLSCSWCRWR